MSNVFDDKSTLRVHRALCAYMDTSRDLDESLVMDLLTDLMHWCEENNVPFDRAYRDAEQNYLQERKQ